MRKFRVKQSVLDFWNRIPPQKRKAIGIVGCVFKWIYRILNRIVRLVLLSLTLYAIAFTLVASFLLYRAFLYPITFYETDKNGMPVHFNTDTQRTITR